VWAHHVPEPFESRRFGEVASHDINYQPGCLAILDTETSTLTPVTEEWLTTSRAKDFDPDTWFQNFASS
jgi:hypothetical protein